MTLPEEIVDENPELVQLYEVAAGVQVAVSVDESPRLMVVGDAVRAQLGGWFTVTVAEAAAPVPAALVPVTE